MDDDNVMRRQFTFKNGKKTHEFRYFKVSEDNELIILATKEGLEGWSFGGQLMFEVKYPNRLISSLKISKNSNYLYLGIDNTIERLPLVEEIHKYISQ